MYGSSSVRAIRSGIGAEVNNILTRLPIARVMDAMEGCAYGDAAT